MNYEYLLLKKNPIPFIQKNVIQVLYNCIDLDPWFCTIFINPSFVNCTGLNA